MVTEMPPPGWYPDPSNDQQLRWWTGERWTGAARPIEPTTPPNSAEELIGTGSASGSWAQPEHGSMEDPGATRAMPVATAADAPGNDHLDDGMVAAAGWGEAATPADAGAEDGWPKERKVAAGALGALLLVPLLIWVVAMTGQGGDGTLDVAVDDEGAGAQADGAEDGEEATDGDGEPTEEGTASADTEASDETADDTVEAGERVVDFDGKCEVELDPEQASGDAVLRPWQFEECRRAPIDLSSGEERWIVVIASIDGESTEQQALDRADGYGLLWSSHYPSLNPGWWVIFDGPFSSEEDAVDAAEAAEGGAYPRVLTDDEGDRYCIAEDGC